MTRFEDSTPRAEEKKKPLWRTPKLTVEKVAPVTSGDYVPVGNDGGDSHHAQGFTTPS